MDDRPVSRAPKGAGDTRMRTGSRPMVRKESNKARSRKKPSVRAESSYYLHGTEYQRGPARCTAMCDCNFLRREFRETKLT